MASIRAISELSDPASAKSSPMPRPKNLLSPLDNNNIIVDGGGASGVGSGGGGGAPATVVVPLNDQQRGYQLKKFSQSTPALQPQPHCDLNSLGRSKSRQKKFLRVFADVPRDERVLNCKSTTITIDSLRFITLQKDVILLFLNGIFSFFVFFFLFRLFVCLGRRHTPSGPPVRHPQLLCISLQCFRLRNEGNVFLTEGSRHRLKAISILDGS